MFNKKTIIVAISLIVVAGLIYIYENKGREIVTPIELPLEENMAEAYFAGGCFWCVESDFEKIPGVYEVISGYMGGKIDNPTYEKVSAGETNYRESVEVAYNPQVVTYEELVWNFFRHIDPTDTGGSFYDRGHQYTSAVYYRNEIEKETVAKVVALLEANQVFPLPIATSIEPVGKFWQAEDYHQDYYKKNPLRYKYYRSGSGRDKYIESIWGLGKFDNLGAKK